MIFDSHFQLLSMQQKALDTTIDSSLIGLECATEPLDIQERIKLVGNNRNIYLSIGAGPWCTTRDEKVDSIINKLLSDIKKYNCDAIGECGFDFFHQYGEKEKQEELFDGQSRIAKRYNVPLIIHSRNADDVLLEHIHEIDDKTIMHCFSSNKDVMFKLLDRGAYISFSGNVTYKNNIAIQDALVACPLDRLLYETDSPYLTPVPLRGKPNRMENTEIILSYIASKRNEDKDLIKERVIKNFLTLMNNRESVVNRDIAIS